MSTTPITFKPELDLTRLEERSRELLLTFQQRYVGNFSRILEIGCKEGDNLKIIHHQHQHCSFLGIDASSSCITAARQAFPTARFCQADLKDITLLQRFDTIIVTLIIGELSLEESADLMAKLSTVMPSGGHLFISFPSISQSMDTETCSTIVKNGYYRHPVSTIRELLKTCSLIVFDESEHAVNGCDDPIAVIFAKKK